MSDFTRKPHNLLFAFDIVSPYSYIGYKLLQRYKEKWGLNINYVPVNIISIFKLSENPPPITFEAKRNYCAKDFKNLAEYYEIDYRIPQFFPIDSCLINQVLVIVKETNPDCFESFLDSAWDAFFVEEKDLSKMEVVSELVQGKFGSQADSIMANAKKEEIKNKIQHNSEDMVKQGAFGLPFFKIDNEKFGIFGSDRIALIAWKLGQDYEGPVPGRKLSQPTECFKNERSLVFYFDILSPFSYVARKILQKFEAEWQLKIDYQPVLLATIIKESGNQGPISGGKNKRIYTIRDLKLLCEAYDIPYSFPTKFPFATKVGQTLLSILREKLPEKYNYSLATLWDAAILDHKDINDPTVLRSLLQPLCIHDLTLLVEDACKPDYQDKLEMFSKDLVEKEGAFGLPYFLAKKGKESKHFFGSDRIGALAHYLQLPYCEPIRHSQDLENVFNS